jgi:Cytochrome c7 and related cytochrome c
VAFVFPEWSDTGFRLTLIGVALAIPGVFVVPMLYVRSPYNLDRQAPVEQPVQFDHRHHTKDDGIDCLYCHGDAERAPFAGVPTTELCMGCHSQIWNKSPMLEPVRRSYFSGQPIAWSRVHRVPDFVYFNHAAHVTGGGVACVTCHGDVTTEALVERKRLFTMGWCLDCHRQRTSTLPEPAVASLQGQTKTPPDAPGHPATLNGPSRLTSCTTCHR